MTILALETSCDETSSAVVRDGRVLSSVVSSQVKLHAQYGGVVPELAAREHLRNLIPVVRTALSEAGVEPGQLDAVAATQGPGLPTALLVGFKAAQAVAFSLRKPFVGIHHHEAHLYSPWISQQPAPLAPSLAPSDGERVVEDRVRSGNAGRHILCRLHRLSTERFPHRQRRAHAARAGGIGTETSRARLDGGRCGRRMF